MNEHILLTSQKNQVLELIKEIGLDPFNFEWTTAKSKHSRGFDSKGFSAIPVSELVYKDSPFYFIFDLKNDGHFSIFSPGEDISVEERHPGDWESQLMWVSNWLTYLKREIEEPDLWGDLSKYQLPPGETLSPDVENSPFTVFQAEQISKGIENIRVYLLGEYSLDAQQELINEKLDYLIEASKRQGRKDWLHTSIGVIFAIAVGLAMSPEKAMTVWTILRNAVSGIIQFLPM